VVECFGGHCPLWRG